MQTAPASRTTVLLVALGLLITMNGPGFYLQFRVLDHPWDWEGPVVRELFLALGVAATLAVVLAAADGRRPAVSRPGAVAVGGFTAWIVATSLWSVAPEVTRGRSLVYVGLACFAVVLAGLDLDDRRRALAGALVVVLVASLLAVLVSESIGRDFNGDWRGIFTNRNSLAPLAGLAILVGGGAAIERRGRGRIGPLALVALAALLMVGSASRTAWLAVVAAAGAGAVVVATRRARVHWGVRASVVGAGTALVGFAAVAAVVARMWGEPTFAQRRTIWRLVWDQVGERPVLGHGWFTMWTQPEFTSAHELLGRGSAHNGLMDVWLGAGVIGVVGFVAVVGLALGKAAAAAWSAPDARTGTWLAVVAFLVIENITESFVLWYSYNWVLLMAAALTVGPPPRLAPAPRTSEASEPVSV